jgi:hypothetical protein
MIRAAVSKVAIALALVAGLLWSSLAVPAGAAWISTAGGSTAGRASALTAPGAPAATCDLALDAAVTVTWTAASTTWASGYEVRWGTTSGGPYPSSSGIVSGLSYTTPELGLGTYYFVVHSAKEAWRSTPTTEVSKTVVVILILPVCV